MLHKEFWGLLFLGFVAWIFVSANPNERIERVCRPVGWSGNVVVSLSALIVPAEQKTVQSWFDKLEYGCRYTAWRLMYQADYNAYINGTKSDAGHLNAVTSPALDNAASSASAPVAASAPSATK